MLCNIYACDNIYKVDRFIYVCAVCVLLAEPLFAGFALKLILNAISTGANILKGKVYQNTMINLTVANDKVSHRSVLEISAPIPTP